MKPAYRILTGDVMDQLRTLPDESVHCVVTSPPYWGLRDYGVEGQLGLEKTPQEYIEKMVAVFREVRRVMRNDATAWINLGDTYAHNGPCGGSSPVDNATDERGPRPAKGRPSDALRQREMGYGVPLGLKPKDLIGMPWRLTFALQADGWWLRQDIVWHKPNPMPESVTDRCTKAHEYVFLLTKRARYYFDAEGIKEDGSLNTHSRGRAGLGSECAKIDYKCDGPKRGNRNNLDFQRYMADRPLGTARTKRSVWTIPSQPFPGAHFATYPEKLVEPCILAGTSDKGCCPKCGKPWVRVVDRSRTFESGSGKAGHTPSGKNGPNLQGGGETLDIRRGPVVHSATTGWRPSCGCGEAEPVPCTVLDPFLGSGTTIVVALRHGRSAVGIELKPEYVELAEKRIRPVYVESQGGPLFMAMQTSAISAAGSA